MRAMPPDWARVWTFKTEEGDPQVAFFNSHYFPLNRAFQHKSLRMIRDLASLIYGWFV
jgi:hypothetical protein